MIKKGDYVVITNPHHPLLGEIKKVSSDELHVLNDFRKMILLNGIEKHFFTNEVQVIDVRKLLPLLMEDSLLTGKMRFHIEQRIKYKESL